jgi:DNA-binding IclR family transcriptional regulator
MAHVGSKTQAFGSASGRFVLASMPPSTVAAMLGGHLMVPRPAGA